MASIDDIGTPGQPMSVKPLTAWQAAVRDALNGLRNIPQLTVLGRGASGGIGGLTPSVLRKDFSLADASTIGNLLTPNQASGTDYLGTVEGFFGPFLTFTSSTAAALCGSRSLKGTATTGFPYLYVPGDEGIETYQVTPGRTYTASAATMSPTATVGWVTALRFWDSSGAHVSTVNGATSPLSSTFRSRSVTAVAPPAAAFAAILLVSDGPGADAVPVGTEFYFDCFGLWQGAGGEWAMPGTPITGLGTRITRPNIDDRLVEVWNPSKAGGAGWSVLGYDSGLRDIRGLLINGWDGSGAGVLSLRMAGETVFCSGYLVAGSSEFAFSIPQGFRPLHAHTGVSTWAAPSASGPSGVVRVETDTMQLQFYSVPEGQQILFDTSWTRQDSTLPTSLPGVLVSPAPQ